MNDISVSRAHAEFKLTNYGLFVEDKQSKFGTLVLIRDPFPILKDRNSIILQVGRSVVNCRVECNWRYVMRFSKYKEEAPTQENVKRKFLLEQDEYLVKNTVF